MTEPPTTPYWLANLLDPAAGDAGEAEVTRRGLLADIADLLHTDAIVIAVCAGMVLAVLAMAAGSWLATQADMAWVAAHPVVGGAR